MSGPIRLDMPEFPGGFTSPLHYTSIRSEQAGYGWSTDYPRGDVPLTLRLSELTTTPASRWQDGEMGIAAMRANDPKLSRCPFLLASDVGTRGFSNDEVDALRPYFLNGCFLWVDDFWESAAWKQWERDIGRVLPEYTVIDLPLDDPLFSIVYTIEEVSKSPTCSSGAPAAARLLRGGGPENANAHLRAITDDHSRILVLMSHKMVIADGWNMEADDPAFFFLSSPPTYAVEFNVLAWIMTHSVSAVRVRTSAKRGGRESKAWTPSSLPAGPRRRMATETDRRG